MYYSDCWTYPKEKINGMISEVKKELTNELTNVSGADYLKMADGTLIQWGSLTIDSVTAGNYKSFEINLPISFLYDETHDYVAFGFSQYEYPTLLDIVATHNAKDKITLYAYCRAQTEKSGKAGWIAVGRWK